jgi:hypothetical protein
MILNSSIRSADRLVVEIETQKRYAPSNATFIEPALFPGGS